MKLIIEMSIPGISSSEQELRMFVDMGNKMNDITNCVIQPVIQPDTQQTLQSFMQGIIKEKRENENRRTAEAYQSALNSFNKFTEGRQMPFSQIDSSVMESYEAYLRKKSVCMNTVSFYMRILKAVYKRAVLQKITHDRYPFGHVYTGVAKTQKRALDIGVIRQIRQMALTDADEQLARDLFLFSFYTRGMSFVDMAYLKKSDLKNGVLRYVRRKTGQPFSVRWEPAMQEIVDSYHSSNETYLLPIIKRVGKSERSQYRFVQYRVNKSLNAIGKRLMLQSGLTMYVARHSWASIAKSVDVPLAVISDAMGHSSEKMTSIYLKSMNEWRVHYENERIIHLVQ